MDRSEFDIVPLDVMSAMQKPRRVRPLASTRALFLLFLFLLLPVLLLEGIAVGNAVATRALQTRGVETVGRLVGQHTAKMKDGSLLYYVDYRYTPSGGGAVVASDRIDAMDYERVRLGDAIPVLYDPLVPDRSAANLRGRVGKRDPYGELRFVSAIAAVFALVLLVAFGSVRRAVLRERRLLETGMATRGTMTTVEIPWYGRKRFRYEFRDGLGKSVSGYRLTAKRESVAVQRRLLEAVTAETVVLYDSRNSSVNMLYPGVFFVVER